MLVLDWVDGLDLGELLAERGRPGLPVSSVLRWAAQAAEALSVLHAHGVIHGDVKPANLVLDRNGRVVLVDLGSSSVPGGTGPQRRDAGLPCAGGGGGRHPDGGERRVRAGRDRRHAPHGGAANRWRTRVGRSRP